MTEQFATDAEGSSRPATVSITSPGGMIAAVPALLGHTPHESLVVIMQHRRGGRSRVGALLRADLPTSGAPATDGAANQADRDHLELIDVLRARIAATDPDAVALLVVSGPIAGTAGDPSPAYASFVDAVTDAFTAAGLPVSAAYWIPHIAHGAPWRCYGPCGCDGTLPDPAATEIAAHQALLGKVTYRSRQDAEDALAPEPRSASARTRQLLDTAHDRAAAARARDRVEAARDDLDTVRAAAVRVGQGEGLDEDTLARVVAALCDPAVRDVCLGFVLGGDPAVRAEHAERLWWALTRAAPGPEVAEPATLLACTALLHGGGAHVRVALERATAAHPGHRLSQLVAAMVDQGMDPATLRGVVTDAAADSAARLTR